MWLAMSGNGWAARRVARSTSNSSCPDYAGSSTVDDFGDCYCAEGDCVGPTNGSCPALGPPGGPFFDPAQCAECYCDNSFQPPPKLLCPDGSEGDMFGDCACPGNMTCVSDLSEFGLELSMCPTFGPPGGQYYNLGMCDVLHPSNWRSKGESHCHCVEGGERVPSWPYCNAFDFVEADGILVGDEAVHMCVALSPPELGLTYEMVQDNISLIDPCGPQPLKLPCAQMDRAWSFMPEEVAQKLENYVENNLTARSHGGSHSRKGSKDMPPRGRSRKSKNLTPVRGHGNAKRSMGWLGR